MNCDVRLRASSRAVLKPTREAMDAGFGRNDRVLVRHDNGLRETATVIAVRRIAGGAYVRLRMSDGTDYIAPVSHVAKREAQARARQEEHPTQL
jgi:hypothetical protein